MFRGFSGIFPENDAWCSTTTLAEDRMVAHLVMYNFPENGRKRESRYNAGNNIIALHTRYNID